MNGTSEFGNTEFVFVFGQGFVEHSNIRTLSLYVRDSPVELYVRDSAIELTA